MSFKNKKYTILFICTYLNYFNDNHASFNRMYHNLIYFHKHKNFNVIVLQPNRDLHLEKKELKKDILTYYFKEIRFLRNTLVPFVDFNPFFITKVLNLVKNYQIDLVHIDFLYGINCLGLITKNPIVYSSHNVEYLYARNIGKYYYKIPLFFRWFYSKYYFYLEKFALKIVKSINAISQLDKDTFIKIYNINPNMIIVSTVGCKENILNNPIEKKTARCFLNLHDDINKFILIFHGNYFENWANAEAINLFKNKISARLEDENILILIAGKMPYKKNLKNLKFLGFIPKLEYLLYAADLAVVPILRGAGIKTKMIDYMSANLPIVTSKKGSEGLLLENGIHCIITKNNIDDIINKIIFLKENPNKIKELRDNIKKLVIKEYKWEDILKTVEKSYIEIILNIRKINREKKS